MQTMVLKPLTSCSCLLSQLGLAGLCEPVEGNFLRMPFEEGSFDGAYAIEATCHAPKVPLIGRSL